jgi:O-antigen/teichoic acid export membrane protein
VVGSDATVQPVRRSIERARSLAARPSMRVLGGRAVYQFGQFVFLVAPRTVMTAAEYERFTLLFVIPSIVVVALLIALHAAMLRGGERYYGRTRPYLCAGALAVPLVVLSILITVFQRDVGRSDVAAVFVFAGASGLTADLLLSASLLARAGRFARSAVVEAVAGTLLVVVTMVLVLADVSSLTGWALGYLVVSSAGALVGRTATRTGGFGTQPAQLSRIGEVVWEARGLLLGGLIASMFNRADFVVMSWVASSAEASTYALATRFAGPVLVGLGALNNTLYMHQLAARGNNAGIARITARATHRVFAAAAAVCLAAALVIAAAGVIIDSETFHATIAPSIVLLAAAALFATSVPWGFAMNAAGRESTWNTLLVGAIAFDLLGVLIIGRRGALEVALCWLATQAVLIALVVVARRRIGLVASATTA